MQLYVIFDPKKDPDWVHQFDTSKFGHYKHRGNSDTAEICPQDLKTSKYYDPTAGNGFRWSAHTGLLVSCASESDANCELNSSYNRFEATSFIKSLFIKIYIRRIFLRHFENVNSSSAP